MEPFSQGNQSYWNKIDHIKSELSSSRGFLDSDAVQ